MSTTDPRVMEAVDEIVRDDRPDPAKSSETLAILKNNNKNRPIVARVRVDGPPGIIAKRFVKPNVEIFPHEFDILIRPGARVSMGRTSFTHARWNNALQPPDFEEYSIPVIYTITGANWATSEYDSNPPRPDIAEVLGYFNVKSRYGGMHYWAVNLGHVWAISAEIEAIGRTNQYWSANVTLFETRRSHYDGLNEAFGWKISQATLIPVYAPA